VGEYPYLAADIRRGVYPSCSSSSIFTKLAQQTAQPGSPMSALRSAPTQGPFVISSCGSLLGGRREIEELTVKLRCHVARGVTMGTASVFAHLFVL
jgi:hypothetical protein